MCEREREHARTCVYLHAYMGICLCLCVGMCFYVHLSQLIRSCWCTAWVAITQRVEMLTFRPLRKRSPEDADRAHWHFPTETSNALTLYTKLLLFSLLQNILWGQAKLPTGLWGWRWDSCRGTTAPFITGYYRIYYPLSALSWHRGLLFQLHFESWHNILGLWEKESYIPHSHTNWIPRGTLSRM